MKHIFRKYERIIYSNDIQTSANISIFADENINDFLYIADDSEWVSPVDDVKHIRYQNDIISHQYNIKYRNYPVIGYIIFRNRNDEPFGFWDIVSVILQYLDDVGYKEHYSDKEIRNLSKNLNVSTKQKANWSKANRIPPVIMAGFFQGVDVTAYKDWYKYLDVNKQKSNKKDAMIALYKDVFFTSQLTLAISSKDRKRKVPLRIQYRDTMALAPQGGLTKLGNIVNQPKLDTSKWDSEDNQKGLISDTDYYAFLNQGGFYKNHMRLLLQNRHKDFVRYAMGDSEITLKYLGFFLNQELKVYHMGLIKSVHIPATLTSLSDEISDHYARIPYDDNQVANTLNQLFHGDSVELYLRPDRFNQQPPKLQNEWKTVLDLAVNPEQAVDSSDFKDRVALQRKIIAQLRSFFSCKAIYWKATSNNKFPYLSKDITKRINYRELYKRNPDFNPLDFIDNGTVKIRQYHPNFKNLPQLLTHNYHQIAYRLERNRKNELPSLSDLLTYLWDKSVYGNYYHQDGKSPSPVIVNVSPVYWLEQKIDFRYTRLGYYFDEPDSKVEKHESKAHDLIAVQPDSTYNQGFHLARNAYLGGMNLCYCPGILKFKYTYDVDLKSSYVNAGHLIPDFRLDVPANTDINDLSLDEFNQNIKPNLPNGVFSVGVCDVDYKLPDGLARVPVGVKAAKKGATPRYVLEHSRARLMLTDVFDLIAHDADVYFHRIIIPVQKKLNADFNQLSSVGKMQDWSLTQRNLAKKEYGKKSPEQEFFKLLGNGGYGKTGQGLSEKVSRSYNDGQTYFVPFSRSTNPWLAAQYTAIARYQVNFLMDTMQSLVTNSIIPSVTTDGFIFCSNSPVDPDKLVQTIRQNAPQQWVRVNDRWFKGEFFEFKSKLKGDKSICSVDSTLVNLRTRFNFTLDGRIEALTGVLNMSFEDIYQDLLANNVVLDVESHRLASLVDMKHRVDYKYLLNEWTQPVKLNLGYDDTYRLTKFHDNGDGFGWYESKPFETVDEVETFKEEMKPFRRLFPLFNTEYANAWLSFDNDVISDSDDNKHIAWVNDDVHASLRIKKQQNPTLKANNYSQLIDKYTNNYAPKVFLRYLHANQSMLDFNRLYNDYFSEFYASFSGFKQAIKRANGFVNDLVVLKEGWNDFIAQYKEEN